MKGAILDQHIALMLRRLAVLEQVATMLEKALGNIAARIEKAEQ